MFACATFEIRFGKSSIRLEHVQKHCQWDRYYHIITFANNKEHNLTKIP